VVAVKRIASVREHTGDPQIDRIQRQRDVIAKALNALAGDVEALLKHVPVVDGRLDALERLRLVGRVNRDMLNANQTLTESENDLLWIRVFGTLTANRTLTIRPAATDAGAHFRFIQNACGGSFSVVVSMGSGSTRTVPNGTNEILGVTPGGVFRFL
jgi:hypothetical protein